MAIYSNKINVLYIYMCIYIFIQDTDFDKLQYKNQKKIKNNKNKGKSFGERNQESYGSGSTITNRVHAPSNMVLEKDDIQRILEKKGLPYQAKLDKSHAGTTHVEKSLADHTDIDNMDENNKFICKVCSGREGFT